MPARILDGVAIGNQIREEVRPSAAAFTARVGRPAGLGIVLVGNDPASEVYVRNKIKAASEVGLRADLEVARPAIVILQKQDWRPYATDSMEFFLSTPVLRDWLMSGYRLERDTPLFAVWRRTQ